MQVPLSHPTRPRLWKIRDGLPMEPIIREASLSIGRGGVIIYPTETFYALGGLPTSQGATGRIFAIKGRGHDKPLPLIASCQQDVRQVTAAWPDTAERLAGAFWPGPLTLLLPASPKLPAELHWATDRIAVRISSHPVATALAEAVGGLLISTSANISGQPAVADPADMEPVLTSQVDGLINAGRLTGGRPSSIVDLSQGIPRLIRAGSIPWRDIRAVLQA